MIGAYGHPPMPGLPPESPEALLLKAADLDRQAGQLDRQRDSLRRQAAQLRTQAGIKLREMGRPA